MSQHGENGEHAYDDQRVSRGSYLRDVPATGMCRAPAADGGTAGEDC